MTTEQFLNAFRHSLTVGGQKREEIIAEVSSHLQEQSADKLGDPVRLAQRTNRVHVGFFASFQSLVIAAAITTLLFDVLIPYVGARYDAKTAGVSPLEFLWLLVPLVSPILFIYGAHAISRMQHRWIYAAVYAAVFTAGFALQQEIMQATGFLFVSTVSGSSSVWSIHIQPVVNFFFPYAVIGYAVMVITAGRQFIVSRHQLIDIVLAFLLGSAGAYYILPMMWNSITSFHYTENMSDWASAAFTYLSVASICIGVLCAVIEWFRIRSVKKFDAGA